MNTIWSTYVQTAEMLDQTRVLRFADCFRDQYRAAFAIPDGGSMLEIGAGTGALSRSLKRWYPGTQVVGLDRDSAFIDFAAKRAPEIRYLEGDATALPFPAESFDGTISNTVQEHIEPSGFFGEQYRVLKKGGVCLVLSSRRTTAVQADCLKKRTDFERAIYDRINPYAKAADQAHGICAYPMTEAELPRAMEKYGFQSVSTEYLALNLTPDHPSCATAFAEAMIESGRQMEMEEIKCWPNIAPGVITDAELDQMEKLIHVRHDERLRLYRAGEKQWDARVLLLMITRGVK